MSTPLLIALIIYLSLLFLFLLINILFLIQINKYAFLGDKTTLGIQLYALFMIIVIGVSSFLLTLYDWYDTPILEIFQR